MFLIRILAVASMLGYYTLGQGDYITVAVGMGGLHFVHPAIPAKPGDVVVFIFYPGDNHTVTQSADFNTPCIPKEGGFNSGFMAYTEAEEKLGAVYWELTINDTEPIWYYCAQKGHCQGGMVGSINPNLTEGSTERYVDFSSIAVHATTASIPSTTGGGRLVVGTESAFGPAPSTTNTITTVGVTTASPTLPSNTIATSSTNKSTSVIATVSVAAATRKLQKVDAREMTMTEWIAYFIPALFFF